MASATFTHSESVESKPAVIRPGAEHFVFEFLAKNAILGYVLAGFPSLGGSGDRGHEAILLVMIAMTYGLPAMFAPTVARTMGRMAKSAAVQICAFLVVHCIIGYAAYFLLVRLSGHVLRFYFAMQCLTFQIKLHEVFLYSVYASRRDLSKLPKQDSNRSTMVVQSTPLARASHVFIIVNILDVEFVPKDEQFNRIYAPAFIDHVRIPGVFLVALVAVNFFKHELQAPLPIPLLILVHMGLIYPLLRIMIWGNTVSFFRATKGWVPRHGFGSSPHLSGSIRELWGRRYNRMFSDLVHRSIFDPLVRDAGFPASAASLVVFTASGLLHALPYLLLPAGTMLQFWGQMAFFLSNWVLCVGESFLVASKSNLRTWILFVLTYTLFGWSSIDGLTAPELGTSYLFSLEFWHALKALAGMA